MAFWGIGMRGFKTCKLCGSETHAGPSLSPGSPGNRKGDTNIDLIMSISIFIIGVMFFLQIISYVTTSYGLEAEQSIRDNLAGSVSAVLFGSEGVPSDWDYDPAAAKQLGLCANFTKICLVSQGKLGALAELSPSQATGLLNLGDRDFRVLVKDADNNVLFEYKSADMGQELGIYQRRCLMFNGSLEAVIATVQVW